MNTKHLDINGFGCQNLQHNSIGYEINSEFIPNIKEKIGQYNFMTVLKLNTGLIVRLIGIKENSQINRRVIMYIKDKMALVDNSIEFKYKTKFNDL